MAHVAEGVEHGKVPSGFALKEIGQGLVAMVLENGQELGPSNDLAGAVDGSGVGVAGLAEQFGDEFGVEFGALEGVLVPEVILVTAVDPVGEILGVEAVAGFAEFVDNDAGGEAVIEHAVDHVAGWFGEPGDFAVAAGVCGVGFARGEVLDEAGGGGHRILDFRFLIFDCGGGREGQRPG